MQQVPISINDQVTNKVPTDPASMRTLNSGFQSIVTHLDDIVSHVLDGHSFCPAHLAKDEHGRSIRKNNAFVQAQLIFLDIDNSVALPGGGKRVKTKEEFYVAFDQIVEDAWFKENLYLAYTTPSHTPEWHRFRLVFCLPEVVDNGAQYGEIIRAFVERFKADEACKSIVHIYYGNTEADVRPYGNVLKQEFVEATIERRKHLVAEMKVIEPRSEKEITVEQCREILRAIPPEPGYYDWMKVTNGVFQKFPKDIAIQLLEEWSPSKPYEYEAKYKSPYKNVTFGSVVWIARSYGWSDPNGIYRRNLGRPKTQLTREDEMLFKYNLTDSGNRERLVEAFDGQVVYDRVANKWLVYDGKRFHEDTLSNVTARAIDRMRAIVNEAEGIDNPAVVDAIEKWSKKSQSRSGLDAALNLATRGSKLAVKSSDFDKDAMLLNLRNCVFDLRTFEATPHDARHLMTKLIDIDLDGDAECPKWIEFLDQTFGGDEEMLTFIRRSVGYSLSGLTDEQYFWFCYGVGSNGKSVFFNALQMLFGDYYHKSPVEMLLLSHRSGGEKSTNDLAAIVGKRLIVTDEFPKGRRLDTERIKNMTGGDVLTARYLFQEFFQFRSQGKLWIYGNHYPDLPERDKGIWRRVLIVPFENIVPEEKQRPMSVLMEEFRAEASGILNWALDGLREYREEADRLAIPAKVIKETDKFKEASDVLGPFLSEHIIDADPNTLLPSTAVYSVYAEWTKSNNEHTWSKIKLTKMLVERGWRTTTKDRLTHFIGKAIAADSPQVGGLW